ATVAQANTALAAAGVTVIGATPAFNSVLAVVPEPGVGNFDPALAAVAALEASPRGTAAGLGLETELARVPPITENALYNEGPDAWIWNEMRNADNGSGKGVDGNWGMEASRFPQSWNILDAVRRAEVPVDTLVIDKGFAPHIDLDETVLS